MELTKLDIKVPKSLKEELKAEAKASGVLFGSYIIGLLEKSRTKPRAKSKELLAPNPEVLMVITHFETNVARVRSLPAARKAVVEMLQDYGFERVIGAINAVKQSQGMDYAPVIVSLPTLQEKWVNLEHFVKRKITKQRSVVFRPTVK